MAQDYKTWLAASGITDPSQFTIGEQTGLVNSYANSLTPTSSPQLDFANSEGLFGVTQGTWGNMGQAAGLAGMGLNTYSDLFGTNAKMNKAKLGELKASAGNLLANTEATKYKLDHTRKFNDMMSGVGQGLAASGSTL